MGTGLRRRRQLRPGAWVAEVAGLFNLSTWPAGMRVIIRKERPHLGAQLRITDLDEKPDHRLRHQHHALTGHPGYEQARRWEPKRLRQRLFSIPAGTPAPAAVGCCTWQRRPRSPRSSCRPWRHSPLSQRHPESPPLDLPLPAPTTRGTPPTSGTGAHPSDLGRTVTPRCQTHAHAGQEPRQR
jgi:hypothetical protein